MVKTKWLLIGGLGAAVAVGAIALAMSQGAQGSPVLVISASDHGKVQLFDSQGNEHTAVGTHTEFTLDETLQIKATADSGYEASWMINDTRLSGYPTEYSLTLAGQTTVNITFIIPSNIGTLSGITGNAVITQQNFRFWVGNGWAGVDVHEADENFNNGFCGSSTLTLLAHDVEGHGIPNIPLAVYVDPNPDGTPYRGLVVFALPSDPSAWQAYGITNPLIVTTGPDGTVRILVRNLYGAEAYGNGFGRELSRDSILWINTECFFGGGGRHLPTYKSDTAGLSCWWTDKGGGGIVDGNKFIKVDVVGSSISTLIGLTYNYGASWH